MVVQSFGKLGIASILSLLLGFQFGDHASDPEDQTKSIHRTAQSVRHRDDHWWLTAYTSLTIFGANRVGKDRPQPPSTKSSAPQEPNPTCVAAHLHNFAKNSTHEECLMPDDGSKLTCEEFQDDNSPSLSPRVRISQTIPTQKHAKCAAGSSVIYTVSQRTSVAVLTTSLYRRLVRVHISGACFDSCSITA